MTQKIALAKTIKELDRRGYDLSINDINEIKTALKWSNEMNGVEEDISDDKPFEHEIKTALKWSNEMNGVEEDISDDKPFEHVMAIVEAFEYINGISNFFSSLIH